MGRGILFALIGATGWGLSGVAGQYLMQTRGVDPLFLTMLRLILGGVLLLLASPKAPKLAVFKNVWSIFQLLMFALIGMLLCQFSYLMTIRYTDAGTATVLQYTAPVLILVVMCVAGRRLPNRWEMLAITMAVAGVFIIATNADPSSLNISTKGLIWGALAAIGLAGYSLIPLKLQSHFPTTVIAGWGMLIGGVILLVIARPDYTTATWDFLSFLSYFTLVVLGTSVAFGCYLTGMKLIGPVDASLVASFEPMVAAVAAWALLGTTFTLWDLVGFTLVMSVVFILAYAKKRQSSPSEGPSL